MEIFGEAYVEVVIGDSFATGIIIMIK